MVKKKEKVKQEEEEEEEEEEKTEKVEETPKYIIELGAKFDKMADAFLRFAEAKVDKQEEDEEEEEEEKKQEEEEEEPEEEEKQKEEEEEKPEEEEKVEKADFFEEEGKKGKKTSKLDEYIKAEVTKQVTEALKKSLETPAKKRSKAIKKVKVTEEQSMAKLNSMTWKEVHELAEARGA